MAESYPTKDSSAPPQYEPPTVNIPQDGSGTSSSMAMTYSGLLAQDGATASSTGGAVGEPGSVQPDQFITSFSAGATPHSGNGASVYPGTGPDNQVVLTRSLPRKSLAEAYILGVPLGFFGAHHFYLRRGGFGVVYLFTFGLFGVGWIADWFRMPWLVKDANKLILDPKLKNKKTISDAYILWFPFGLLGFHHYFLRNWIWGLVYTFTIGLFGVGWIIDAFRLPSLVNQYNLQVEKDLEDNIVHEKRLCDAYLLGATPLGILGAHHYYLGRYLFGVTYTFTGGLFLVGWLIDICRMPVLVERANKEIRDGDDRMKHIDDAYVLCFPLGFLGLHHWYLERHCWGCLYVCTLGLFLVGWILDWCRMPWLVKATNEKISEENLVVQHLRSRMGPNAQVTVTENAVIVNNPGVPGETTGTVHEIAVPSGATATGVTPTHQTAVPMGADPQGQILQPPSYESVFGPGDGVTGTSYSLTGGAVAAAGSSTDTTSPVDSSCDMKRAGGALPTEDLDLKL